MGAEKAFERFLAARATLLATAAPGTDATHQLSRLTDEAVSALAEAASPRVGAPFAILALGGYGAQRLLPHSDIDLLILSPGTASDLEPLIRGLFYPLWDAGFTVGHQVRSPKGQLQAVRDDVQNLTAFLTARPVAGETTVAERTVAEVFGRLCKDRRRARGSIAERERPGSPYLLEPDLKEGAGGQRDLDEMVWYAALVRGTPTRLALGLVASRVLTRDQYRRLEAAQDALSAARWRLHLSAERGRNVLSVEDAESLDIDADALQRHLEYVHHTLGSVRRVLEGDRSETHDPLAIEDLRRAADTGPEALPALERAAWLGRLDEAFPGFSALMSLRRPALTHRYTVGAHCLRTLTLVTRPQADGEPVAVDPRVADPLLVAALVHDAGKQEPGPDHAERGGDVARQVADRLGLPRADGLMAAHLVREHLLLPDIATRADLTDEDMILTTAVRLGDIRLIRPLYLLTAADMQATGPDVWTPWRSALVGDLATRLEAALSPDVDGAGIVSAAEKTRAEATRRASAIGASRTVLAFLEHAPLRYLARKSSDDVLADARLVQSLGGPSAGDEFAFRTRAASVTDTWLLDVVVRDRPGLFAMIAGSLTLSGLDVLAAEVFTEQAGIALDTFVVASATHAAVTDSSWHAFERTLGDVLGGRVDLDARLAERRRYYDRPQRFRDFAPIRSCVNVGPRGAFSTTVHVHAHDRMGLLYDLAHTIERSGLDIRRAMISTVAEVAEDLFEVTDAEGAPPAIETLEETLVPELRRVACGQREGA